jgi:Pyruvate/2-oxoacid:ferredoxin oxidoreductase delta subunit
MRAKYLRWLGGLLLIVGFLLFNALFFLGKYQLSPEIIRPYSERAGAEKINAAFQNLYSKSYSLPFDFVGELNSGLEEVNSLLIDQYSLSGEQSNQWVEQWKNDQGFRVDLTNDGPYQRSKNAEDSARISLFLEFGSWLDGRDYPDFKTLESDLQIVRESINNYGILAKMGFDKYRKKNAVMAISKNSFRGIHENNPILWIFLTFGFCCLGGLLIFLSKTKDLPGIKNNEIFKRGISSRGWGAALLGAYLIVFYIILYFYPVYMIAFIELVDPLSLLLSGNPAGQFFLYGFIYTLVILVMGLRMILKYKHSLYQRWRTVSVMFFQLSFAFLIPEILVALNKPYFDFKNIWPLDYDFFFEHNLASLIQSGGLGIFMLFWGIALIIIAVPVGVYFFGKRWYCSWVCGCGGLAETAGDPFRQLSDKSLKAWRLERILIHSVLGFAIIMTALVLYTYFSGNAEIMGMNSFSIREVYGAWIGAGFAGVIGTGFYPLMGNRVWCRFGCPLAAYLGLIQRFKSRFRITTNGGQCISCGNCSTYCEMGIDVRWYAQRGQNIIRSSCVGCGICSAVCPRGVLNLEVKKEKGRFNGPNWIGQDPSLKELQIPDLPQIDPSPPH